MSSEDDAVDDLYARFHYEESSTPPPKSASEARCQLVEFLTKTPGIYESYYPDSEIAEPYFYMFKAMIDNDHRLLRRALANLRRIFEKNWDRCDRAVLVDLLTNALQFAAQQRFTHYAFHLTTMIVIEGSLSRPMLVAARSKWRSLLLHAIREAKLICRDDSHEGKRFQSALNGTLYWSIREGLHSSVKILLEAGAEPMSSEVHEVITRMDMRMLNILTEGVGKYRFVLNVECMIKAIKFGSPTLVTWLRELEPPCPWDETVVETAIELRDEEMIRCLLGNEADRCPFDREALQTFARSVFDRDFRGFVRGLLSES